MATSPPVFDSGRPGQPLFAHSIRIARTIDHHAEPKIPLLAYGTIPLKRHGIIRKNQVGAATNNVLDVRVFRSRFTESRRIEEQAIRFLIFGDDLRVRLVLFQAPFPDVSGHVQNLLIGLVFALAAVDRQRVSAQIGYGQQQMGLRSAFLGASAFPCPLDILPSGPSGIFPLGLGRQPSPHALSIQLRHFVVDIHCRALSDLIVGPLEFRFERLTAFFPCREFVTVGERFAEFLDLMVGNFGLLDVEVANLHLVGSAFVPLAIGGGLLLPTEIAAFKYSASNPDEPGAIGSDELRRPTALDVIAVFRSVTQRQVFPCGKPVKDDVVRRAYQSCR